MKQNLCIFHRQGEKMHAHLSKAKSLPTFLSSCLSCFLLLHLLLFLCLISNFPKPSLLSLLFFL